MIVGLFWLACAAFSLFHPLYNVIVRLEKIHCRQRRANFVKRTMRFVAQFLCILGVAR